MTSAPSIQSPHRTPLSAGILVYVIIQLFPTASAMGASLSGTAGYDYYAGPSGQTTNTLSGTGVADFGRVNSSLGLLHFNDSQVGQGLGVVGSLGALIAARASLHASASRYIGDSSYRAWRLKLGPAFDLSGGRTFGVYFSHYSDDSSNVSSGVIAELGSPLRENLNGRATAAYASAQGQGSGQGTVGLSWTPATHFELSGDVGLAQSGAGATGAFPSKKSKKSTSAGTPTNPASATAELAVHVTFP